METGKTYDADDSKRWITGASARHTTAPVSHSEKTSEFPKCRGGTNKGMRIQD